MNDIIGHEKVLSELKNEYENGNHTHAYLFMGPSNIGKTKVANRFGSSFLCDEGVFGGCGKCPNCLLLAAGNHPDFIVLDGEDSLGVEEIREITKKMEFKSSRSKSRVVIIANIERLSISAFNSFLKSLEEPFPGNIIILTGRDRASIPDTISSRTRQIQLFQVNDRAIFEHLNNTMLIKRDLATRISSLSFGKIGFAVTSAQNEQQFESFEKSSDLLWNSFRSQSIYDKIACTDSLLKVESLRSQLEFSQLYGRIILEKYIKAGDATATNMVAGFISSLATAMKLLDQNINKKIVMDNLILGNLNG